MNIIVQTGMNYNRQSRSEPVWPHRHRIKDSYDNVDISQLFVKYIKKSCFWLRDCVIIIYIVINMPVTEEGYIMPVSYKRLWHLLIDRNMKKKDLQQAANLTQHIMRKLSRNEAITTDTIAKICRCLDCKVDDIMELTEETK